jgi:hypothetical protein
MIRFYLKYSLRNTIFAQILMRMIIIVPLFFFWNSYGYIMWGVLFLSLFLNFFKNPFACFPEAKNLFLSTGCNISEYIKCANLSLLVCINLSYLVIAICMIFLQRLSLPNFFFLFFFINTGTFFLYTLGNALYFSDLCTMKSRFVQNLIFIISSQLVLTILTAIFLCLKIIPNVIISLFIMLIFTIISFIVWTIAKNKYIHFKYHFPIK